MTSDWSRILKLKCLPAKSYHALQDDAYSHISLIRKYICCYCFY